MGLKWEVPEFKGGLEELWYEVTLIERTNQDIVVFNKETVLAEKHPESQYLIEGLTPGSFY